MSEHPQQVDLAVMRQRHASLEQWAAELTAQTVTMSRGDFLVVIRQGLAALAELEQGRRMDAMLREEIGGERLACEKWTDDGKDCRACWGCRVRAALATEQPRPEEER